MKAKLRGADRDALSLQVGFATDGTTPAAAPDVAVRLGSAYVVTVPGASFGPAMQSRFTAKHPAPGVDLLVLDFRRETMKLTAKNVDLGSFPADASVPVDVTVSIGERERTVRVRVGRRGSVLAY
jgi:hypothetical protein